MGVKKIKHYFFINVFLLLSLTGVSQNWANISTAGPDWVNCGNLDVTGNQITVEALITWTGGSVDIVSKHTGPPNVNYLLRPGEFQLTTSTGYIALINPLPIAFNTTYHVAGVYDGSFLYYYVNGCLTAQIAWSGNLVQNAFLTAIGNQSNCQCEQFDGYINEVRIWNAARTQAQIQANMNTLPSPTTQVGLLAYYSFSSGYTNLQGNTTYNATPVGTISLVTNPFYVAPTVFNATATDVNLICNGVNNGSITTNALGGNTPYTYSLSTGANQTSNTFNNLSAGNYTVTAISADGSCMEQMPITVTTPPAITLTASVTEVSCNGLSTGSATAIVSGGTGPTYTVGIINPPQGGITTGTEVMSGLAAGTYTIGAQDGAGCQTIFPVTIPQPFPLTSVTTQTNVTCFGLSNGSATVTAAGGTAGYTYNWSPSGGTGTVANNLSAQSYTVTVTDAHSCVTTSTLDITQPALPLTALTTSTNVTCNGLANGSATVTVGGGTAGYTYSWTPTGGTATTASNLTPQNYTVTVTDANTCIATSTVNITQPPALTLTAATTSITCFGLSNGSATATVSGGTGPTYTVGIIAPPQGGITTGIETFSGLSSGTYSYGAQDGNGCTIANTFIMAQPATALSATTTQTNVTCFGLATGSATVTAAGGTSGYSYTWSPSGGNAAIASGLTAQPYTVTVADNNLCTVTSTLTITQPPSFIASISTQTNVSCFGAANGGAEVTQTGGTGPTYTYSWTPMGGTTTTASSLTVGIYTATVTDANNCPATTTVNITQPPALTLTATETNVTCFGLSNGTATATVTGGTGPTYTVGIVAPPQGGITTGIEIFNGLAMGTYTYAAQDQNGCIIASVFAITQPPALTLTATQTNVTCNNLSNGSATATATGGTGPYTIGINSTPPQGGISVTGIEPVSGLPAGTYTFGVQDANGCPIITTLTITQPALLTTSILISHNDSCNGDHNGTATATSIGGTTPYSYSWNTTPAQPDSTANNLSVGNYTATVTDAHGCTATTFTTITQPPVLTVSSNSVTICISNTTTLTATAMGGNTALPYTYSIAGTLGNTAVVSPIATTIYTLGVIDIKGCIATNSVIVVVRDSLSSTVNPGIAICNGVSTGLNATGSGGDNTYTYTWLPGSLTGQFVTVQPTITTTYTLVLTDACGTPSVTSVVTITVNPLPSVTFTANPQNGCYPLPVAFASTPQQQTTMPVITNYAWNLGGGYTSTIANPSQVYANPGVYSIIVNTTSDEGCVSTYSVANYITVYNHPVADFTYQPDPANILNPTIQFTDISTAPGSYITGVLWQTFGDSSDSTSIAHNPVHIYQDTGTYCVNLIATNGLGCKDTTQQCVVIKPYFTLYVPNAFSPNGDGINDMFYAIGEYVSSFDMKIFDRWGTVVYHSGNILVGWNGSKGGAVAEEGVYVYLINATDALRKSHSYKGTVTLIK